jgi:ankyrin repeat protein
MSTYSHKITSSAGWSHASGKLALGAALASQLLLVTGCGRTDSAAELLHAVHQSDAAAIRKALRTNSANLNPTCSRSFAVCTPLTIAVRDATENIVEQLIKAGADINGVDANGDTALAHALAQERFGMVRLLVRHGADVNKPNHFGISPFISACKRGNVELIEYFLAAGAEVNASYVNEANPNLPGRLTPLMAAAEYGHRHIIELLVRRGALASARDSKDQTAVDYAMNNDHREAVALLSTQDAHEHPTKKVQQVDSAQPSDAK